MKQLEPEFCMVWLDEAHKPSMVFITCNPSTTVKVPCGGQMVTQWCDP